MDCLIEAPPKCKSLERGRKMFDLSVEARAKFEEDDSWSEDVLHFIAEAIT